MNLTQYLPKLNPKLFFVKATPQNDYLLEYNYKVGPAFNDKGWITGLYAQGIFVDQRTGHIERLDVKMEFSESESLFNGNSKEMTHEMLIEQFRETALKKLANTNHLMLARKTINKALWIQTGIIAGLLTIASIIWLVK